MFTCVDVEQVVLLVETAASSMDAGEENGDDSSEGQAKRLPLVGL